MNENKKVISHYLDGNGSSKLGLPGNLNNDLVWHHMNFRSEKSLKWLESKTHISTHAKSFLVQVDTRPRLIVEDDSIIMCLRGINFNGSQNPEDMISIRIWLNNNTIITSCGRQSRSIEFIEESLKAGNGPKSIADFIIILIEQLALLTDVFIESLEDRLDSEEDNITKTAFDEFNPKMSTIRRQVATFKRYLSPQKEALDKLYRSKTNYLKERHQDLLYVQIDKFINILENLELLRERALMLQEQFMTQVGHQQNSRLYLLSIVSAIFLPLTFLSGLLGMNVGGLPGLESSVAFWFVSGFCFVTTIFLLLFFKKSKWF